MGDDQALCLICCYSFRRDLQDGPAPLITDTEVGQEGVSISLGNHKQFKLFCDQLELIGGGSVGGIRASGRGNDSLFKDKLVTSSFLELLESPSCKGSLEVCPSCLNSISQAMEMRLKGEEVECRVRGLQQEILTQLKEVKGHMEGFYMEVKKIEETVKSSDVNCLEVYISKMRSRRGGSRLRNDIELFRNGIFEVAKELNVFRSSLDRITVAKSGSSQIKLEKIPVKMTSRRRHSRSTVKREEIVTPLISECDATNIDVGDTLPVAVKIEEDAPFEFEEANEDIFPGAIDDLINNADDPLESQVDFFLAEFEEYERDRESDQIDLEYAPPSKKRKVKKNEVKGNRSTTPRAGLRSRKSKWAGGIPTFDFDVDTKGPFREIVISRTLRRLSRLKEEDLASQNAGKEIDIELKYDLRRLYCMKYDEEEDKLMIGDIEVFVNEDGKTIQCSQCTFTPASIGRSGKKNRGHDLDRYLTKHILNKHMDVFRCPLCGEKSTCEWRYRHHLREHKRVNNNLGICCDICAKPCRSNYVMNLHKRTHMNDEEQANAEAAPVSDVEEDPPPTNKSDKDLSSMKNPSESNPAETSRRDVLDDDNYEDDYVEQAELNESASDTGSNYSDQVQAHLSTAKQKKMKEKPKSSSTEKSKTKLKSSTRKRTDKFKRLTQSLSKIKIDTSHDKFTTMEPFKKLMVCRSLQRQSRFEEEELLAKNSGEERDIEVEHNLRRLIFLKYNFEEARLMIGDVEIVINEDVKTLQCSLCSYAPSPVEKSGKKTREHDIERYLVKHVIAKHMGPFGCPLCREIFKLEWQYHAHLREHNGLDIKSCDICGKPCSSRYNIQLHKWTHMNEEDKEEAKRNGLEDPRLKYKYAQDALSNNRYPCPTCGKTFKAEAYLRQHEKSHNARDEIICPKCGKQMLRDSYDVYHKLFACPGNDVEVRRVKCLHCEATFKNMMFMKRHVARNHTSAVVDRPCICEICGKGFKTPDCLWSHKQTHNPNMDWKCGKGCGREFNQRKNWKRHEVNCKGESRK